MAADEKPSAGEWPLAIVLITALVVGALWIVVAFVRALGRSSLSRVRNEPEIGPWAQVEQRLGLGGRAGPPERTT